MKRHVIAIIVCHCSLIPLGAQGPLDKTVQPPRVAPMPSLDRSVRTERASASRAPAARPPRMVWVNEFEPNASEKQLLMVDPSDESRFAKLLAQPVSGITRLLPLSSQGRVVSVDGPEAYRRPGFTYFAATYSFSKKKHGPCLNGWQGHPGMGWAELRLKDGILGAGIMEDSLGLMVRLGDVPLENISVQTAGVIELDTFTPPADYVGARNMFENSLRGIKVGGFLYSSRIPANPDTTYVLRSILRRRADVLVAFRIVRADANGITIVWKKLKDNPKPSWKKKDSR